MEKFKVFTRTDLSYFVTSGFMPCLERSTFQDVEKTLIQILFSSYFNGVKHTHTFINMYACMCFCVDFFFFIKQHVFLLQTEDFFFFGVPSFSLFW